MKRVGVVIATYNPGKYLKPLFRSLNALNYPKKDFKVFVVDDNPGVSLKDEVQSLKDELNVELIENKENLGFAGGNNVGMRKALEWGADYVVLLNQDMEVYKDWLGELVNRIELPSHSTGSPLSRCDRLRFEVGVVQSMILLMQDKDKINSTGERLNYIGIGYSGNCQLSQPKAGQPLAEIINYQSMNNIISYASGASVLFKSDVLKEIGFFDEDFFMYHEDSDLSWRARMAGWEIGLAEKAICYHDYRFNFKPKTFYWTEKNRLAFLLKNFAIKTLVLILPMFLVMEVGMVLYSLVTGWFLWKIKSYAWVLANLGQILKKRREIQKRRKVKDRELKKYLVAGIEFGGMGNPLLRWVANPMMKLYWWIIKPLI